MTELKTSFNELIKIAYGEVETPIVFIDDLDRCSPEGAVELLDAIRMMVGDAVLKCRFVVALDRTVVTRAISQKFSGIKGYDGNRYLEKVFPLSFNVPTAGEGVAVQIFKTLKEELEAKNKENPTILNNIDWDSVASVLIRPQFANPRLMKRCLNYVILTHYFMSPQDPKAKKSEVPEKALTSWIAATQRWPGLRNIMQTRDKQYWEDLLEALEAQDETKLPGPEAKVLLEEPGLHDWLRSERVVGSDPRRSQFRDAEDLLRSFGL